MITEDRTARIIVTEEIQAVTIVVEITEETVISETMEKKDHLTVDRRATVTVVAVRRDREKVVHRDREKAVRHVRAKAMAVQ